MRNRRQWGRILRRLVPQFPPGGEPRVLRAVLAASDGSMALLRSAEGPAGEVWSGGDSVRFDVVASDGTYRGQVTIPGTMFVQEFTGSELIVVDRQGDLPAPIPAPSWRPAYVEALIRISIASRN